MLRIVLAGACVKKVFTVEFTVCFAITVVLALEEMDLDFFECILPLLGSVGTIFRKLWKYLGRTRLWCRSSGIGYKFSSQKVVRVRILGRNRWDLYNVREKGDMGLVDEIYSPLGL